MQSSRGTEGAIEMTENIEMHLSDIEKRVEGRRQDTFTRGAASRNLSSLLPSPTSAPLHRNSRSALRDVHGEDTWIVNSQINSTSCRTANYRRWRGPIRKNIIGHGMSIVRKRLLSGGRFRCPGKPIPVIHQQAREHGAGVFVHPLIEQRANFLTKISSVVKSREFIALERIARSREKELPGRLSLGTGHVGLLRDGPVQGNRAVINVYSTESVPPVEICAKLRGPDVVLRSARQLAGGQDCRSKVDRRCEVMGACSACAGDYEDPDRTAWPLEESEEAEDRGVPEDVEDEFSAEK